MSAILEPTPAGAPPAAPVSPPPTRNQPRSVLPEGVRVDHSHDASAFFEKHVAENRTPAQPTAPASTPTPVAQPEPPAQPQAPVVQPAPPTADVASQLTESFVVKPEAKPADPGPEANPEDRIELTPQASAPAHESFKALKSVTKGLRDQLILKDREVSEARSEVERLKSGAVAVDTPELLQLRKEHEEMSKRLLVLDLEHHPKFKQKYLAPRSQAMEDAQSILAAHGVDSDISGLVNQNPVDFRKSLSAIAAKLPTALDQSDFATAMRTAHSLTQEANRAVSNARAMGDQMRTETVAEQKRSFDTVADAAIKSLPIRQLQAPTGASPEAISEIESFNRELGSLKDRAEKIALGAASSTDIAAAAIRAAAFDFQSKHVVPLLAKSMAARDARIKELEGQLANIRGRNPNLNLGGGSAPTDNVDPTKMDHHAAAEFYANKR